MSGSGAWNCEIKWYENFLGDDDYIAILDDDDSWRKEYISSCYETLLSSPKVPDAVFTFIKRSDCEMCSLFEMKDISIKKLF